MYFRRERPGLELDKEQEELELGMMNVMSFTVAMA